MLGRGRYEPSKPPNSNCASALAVRRTTIDAIVDRTLRSRVRTRIGTRSRRARISPSALNRPIIHTHTSVALDFQDARVDAVGNVNRVQVLRHRKLMGLADVVRVGLVAPLAEPSQDLAVPIE